MMDISIQKNGVGSAIVNELIDYLTTLKYKEVRLGWINGNLQAEHFWISATRSQTVKSLRTSNGFPLFGELVV